jgi:hypothetical protein
MQPYLFSRIKQNPLFFAFPIPGILHTMSESSNLTHLVARLQIITAMIAFGTICLFAKNIALPSPEVAL